MPSSRSFHVSTFLYYFRTKVKRNNKHKKVWKNEKERNYFYGRITFHGDTFTKQIKKRKFFQYCAFCKKVKKKLI